MLQTSDEPSVELAGSPWRIIEQLGNDYREALVLVELEGLTQAAAKRTGAFGIREKSRVQRGCQQLKQ